MNIQKYLSLLPESTRASSRASDVSERDIFFRTKIDQSETTSTIVDSDKVSPLNSRPASSSGDKKGDRKFIQKNIDLVKNSSGDNTNVFMTEDEEKRIEQLLDESDVDESEENIYGNDDKAKDSDYIHTQLAIESFLPEDDRNRLREVESKLSQYQSERSVQLDETSTSSKVSENLISLKTDQTKMNFINTRLRELKASKPILESKTSIELLLQTIPVAEDVNSGEESDGENQVKKPSISKEVLDSLLEQAKKELFLGEEIEIDQTEPPDSS